MQSRQEIDVTTDERFAQPWVTRRIKRSRLKLTSKSLDSITTRKRPFDDHALTENQISTG